MHPKGHLMMADSYCNPNLVLDAGLEPLLRGMIAQPKGKVEPRWALSMAGNFAGHSTINGEWERSRAFPWRRSKMLAQNVVASATARTHSVAS
jgi:hypothetical protein